ncbi:ArsR family transcriptional regulator [Mycetocola tolaasinivorans]|uniref:ArsR family transcriptional regulator n=1 Tax=Mycetocola tolaasinivorans TaxID=76635 RepID=A0A3L7A649_9MICO|nr:metalloregulator ArsR/SmtB family transcription factor [Mycetocola tolaasinivorans]RLP75525.1 ArsR family transcriptional regulator [Mycetocola tolaasinivorans]
MTITTLELTPLPRKSGDDPAARAHALAPLMRALGDPNRLHLVLLLADGPLTVRELTDASGLSQTLVSHHLAPLRELELVTVTPRGRANVYELCCEALATPVRLLASIASATPEGREACCAADNGS